MEIDDSGALKPKVPPPLLVALPLLVGIAIHLVTPWQLMADGALRFVIAVPLVVVGVSVMITAGMTLVRAGTDSSFSGPTTTVVAHGPYRWSRNPIYLGVLVVYVGVAIAVNTLWPMALLPVVVILLWFGAIRPEERYLEDRLGEEWTEYTSRVRRWL